MVVGSPAHWHYPPRSQAYPRASAPSLLAHPASNHAVTLLAPSHDGAGLHAGAPTPRLPLVPAHQTTASPLGAPQPSLNHSASGSCGASVALATAPVEQAGRNREGVQVASDRGSSDTSPSGRGPGSGPGAAPDPAALTSWIKSARNITRLQRLMRQYGNQMNHIHVSALVTHLSQLAAEDSATAAALASAAATAADPSSNPTRDPRNEAAGQRHCAEAAPSRPQHDLPVPPPSCGGGCTGPPAESAPSRSSSADGAAAAAAGVRELLASLLALVHAQLPYFEPRQLANTAWALGKWPAGVPGRDGALAAVLQASGPLLPRFRPQELANLLHGWASCAASSRAAAPLSPPPPPAPSSAPWETTSRASSSQPQQKQTPVEQQARQQAAPQPVPQWQPLGWLTRHARACASQLRPGGRFKMQELSNLLWAWGVLLGGAGAGGGGGDGAGAGAGEMFPYWVSGARADGGGPATGGQATPAAAAGLAVPYRELLAAQMQLGLEAAGPQELANSMLSLARLQLLPPPEWFDAFLRASRRHLLPDSSTSIATTGNRDGDNNGDSRACPPFGGRWPHSAPAASTSRGRDPARMSPQPPAPHQRLGFSPQELSNLLWGCSKLHLRLPPGFLDDVAPALERCLPLMSLQERINVLWALAWQAKLGAGEWAMWEPTAQPSRAAAAAAPAAAAAAVTAEAAAVAVESGASAGLCRGQGVGGEGSQAASEGGSSRAPSRGREEDDQGVAEQSRTGRALSGSEPWGQDSGAGAGATAPFPRAPVAAAAGGGDGGGGGGACGAPRGRVPDGAGGGNAVVAAEPGTRSGGPVDGPHAPPPPVPAAGVDRRGAARAAAPPADATAALGRTGHADRAGQSQPPPQPAAGLAYPRPGPAPLDRISQDQFQQQQTLASHLRPAADEAPHGSSAAARVIPAPTALREPQRHSGGGAPLVLRRVVRAVLHPLQRSPDAAGPQDVSVALWSVATLSAARAGGCCRDPAVAAAAATIPTTTTTTPLPSSRGAIGGGDDGDDGGELLAPEEADALLSAWGRCLDGMSPQGQANCVWAAARLRLAPPAELQGRLAAWLARHAGALSPPECAATLRGLGLLAAQGALAPRPAPELSRAARALLDQAYLRHARYEPWELAQVCYGGALLLRWLGRGGGAAAAAAAAAAAGGSDMAQQLSTSLPAAAAVRMSMDLEDAAAGAFGLGPALAPAAAAAVAAQQRRLAQPLDALLAHLQLAYRRAEVLQGGAAAWDEAAAAAAVADSLHRGDGGVLGLEALVMTLEAVAAVLPAHVSPTRGSELSVWCQDLVRVHARRALTQAPHHVRALAPLLHACAAAAVSSVRVARARRQAALERRRAAAAAAGSGAGGASLARSSMDEFMRSGRLAQRREELLLQLQAKERQEATQQEELPRSRLPQPPPPSRHVQEQQQRQAQQQQQQQQQDEEEASYRTRLLQTPAQALQQQTSAEDLQGLPAPAQPAAPAQPPAGPLPQSAAWAASGLSPEWLQRFWAASGPSLRDATPQEAAMMLWAMSSLAVQPPDPWVGELLRAVERHLLRAGAPGVSDHTLGVLLSSLGHLRVRPSARFMAAALAAVDAWAAAGCGEGRRREMAPSAVLGVLVGLAYLEWPLPPEWLARLVRAVAPQLGRLTPGAERTRAYMAVASLDAGLAERLGYEFGELLGAGPTGAGSTAGRGGGGGRGRGVEWERAEEGTAQQRTLFSRSRGGW
ncbi:hypothetical protein PLESTB_000208500 [Pleodorina starrii]|uniref:Uncharacterized protein n=1 Tax=Pleodorina starrii TaxID=330485 RepID=A0A9W6BC50_9CHLO|nr:hypothetical protein PLESTM_000323200 [Pleodorina starrii]GLC49339.1 hypothetical protein PLESTB_000208500 [Pleodorina starrii]GLC73403.1 hypothetical protein PLESTF_001371600 [Pleodorina starrii]